MNTKYERRKSECITYADHVIFTKQSESCATHSVHLMQIDRVVISAAAFVKLNWPSCTGAALKLATRRLSLTKTCIFRKQQIQRSLDVGQCALHNEYVCVTVSVCVCVCVYAALVCPMGFSQLCGARSRLRIDRAKYGRLSFCHYFSISTRSGMNKDFWRI